MTRHDPATEVDGAERSVGTLSDTTATSIARLRWRGSWWSPSTATRVRIFARPADCRAAARRLEAKGYEVELSSAERTPWRVVRPEPWRAPKGMADGEEVAS